MHSAVGGNEYRIAQSHPCLSDSPRRATDGDLENDMVLSIGGGSLIRAQAIGHVRYFRC